MKEETRQPRLAKRLSLTTFSAFQYRSFRYLWLAQIGSGFTMQAEMLIRSWLILELTGSGVFLAAAHVVRSIGTVLVTPAAGVLADRFDRRILLMSATAINSLFFLLLGLLVISGQIAVWHVVASAMVAGAAMAIQQTSSQAVIPSLVPREGIMNAASLNSVVMGRAP